MLNKQSNTRQRATAPLPPYGTIGTYCSSGSCSSEVTSSLLILIDRVKLQGHWVSNRFIDEWLDCDLYNIPGLHHSLHIAQQKIFPI